MCIRDSFSHVQYDVVTGWRVMNGNDDFYNNDNVVTG